MPVKANKNTLGVIKVANPLVFSPAEGVDHHSNREGADHAPHTEDGHSEAPHQGGGSQGTGFSEPFRGYILEKRAQFLAMQKQTKKKE